MNYNFPSRIKTLCQLDVSRFPFDVQTCSLTFGSWACNGLELDVTSKSNIADISAVVENAEWEIVESPIARHEIIYGCCPEPYPDITIYINLRRKPTHYIINIIIPSILITCVAVLGFILPVDAGEKIGLQLTVMLTISVFQMLVAEKLPPAADSQPRICKLNIFQRSAWFHIMINNSLSEDSVYCVTPIQHLFSYIMASTSQFSIR